LNTLEAGLKTVHVPLGARSYDVVIGRGLLAQAGERILPFLNRPQVVVITDENVAGLHLESLRDGLAAAGISMTSLVLPAGEATKGWPEFERTLDWLLEQRVERNDVVVAFGGGVIGRLCRRRAAPWRAVRASSDVVAGAG
jgi:3-dehydroquinate synthase